MTASGTMPKQISMPLPAIALTTRLIALLLFCSGTPRAGALTAVDDSAGALPNTPVTLAVLANDLVSTSNAAAILRVTQPAHGRVVINSAATTNAELKPLIAFAAVQSSNTVTHIGNTNLYPKLTLPDGSWDTAPIGDNNWVSGFFPGALWQLYELTGDANFKSWAESWTAGIAPMQFSTNVDDVGFMILTSFGNAYRTTTNASYRAVLLQAARSLTNRFNAVVGCLADDRLLTPPPFEVIMDTMMNSELLFRAYDLSGDTNFYNLALSHAEKTMLNHVRADGSTYHMVIYDATNGAVLYQGNRAIDPPLDTWARGHAWATYGFTMAFRETGDTRFLDTARRLADFYLDHVPADYVPYWYFSSNGIPPVPPLRDSSAAAIMLAALVELSQLTTNSSDGAKYWLAAHRISNSLSSTGYLAQGTTNRGILLHGNPVDSNVDASLIYGDYYFIESLKRFHDLYGQTTLTYVPDADFSGTDSFTYQVGDSSGATATATVTITVGLVAQIVLASATHQPVISFPTVAGKNYFVQYRNSLGASAGWSSLATNLAGSGAVVFITDTTPPGARFYRVGVE